MPRPVNESSAFEEVVVVLSGRKKKKKFETKKKTASRRKPFGASVPRFSFERPCGRRLIAINIWVTSKHGCVVTLDKEKEKIGIIMLKCSADRILRWCHTSETAHGKLLRLPDERGLRCSGVLLSRQNFASFPSGKNCFFFLSFFNLTLVAVPCARPIA